MVARAIRADDGGIALGQSFGGKRLKALLFLSQHPELDEIDWQGKVELHFSERFVKGCVHPAPSEIGGF